MMMHDIAGNRKHRTDSTRWVLYPTTHFAYRISHIAYRDVRVLVLRSAGREHEPIYTIVHHKHAKPVHSRGSGKGHDVITGAAILKRQLVRVWYGKVRYETRVHGLHLGERRREERRREERRREERREKREERRIHCH